MSINDHQELVMKTTDELEKINKSLQIMNAHVGYRVRDEICFYLAYNEEDQLMEYHEAFDHCIFRKFYRELPVVIHEWSGY